MSLLEYEHINTQFRGLIAEHFNPGVQSSLAFRQSFYSDENGVYNLTVFLNNLKKQGHHLMKTLLSEVTGWSSIKGVQVKELGLG